MPTTQSSLIKNVLRNTPEVDEDLPDFEPVDPDNVVDFEIPTIGKPHTNPPLQNARRNQIVVKNEKPIHRTAAWMYAAGHGTTDIALALNVTKASVSNWIAQSWFRDLVVQFHSETGQKETLQSRFVNAGEQAFQRIYQLMNSSSDAVALKASTEIIDRVMGKAPVMVKNTPPAHVDPLDEAKALDDEIRRLTSNLREQGLIIDMPADPPKATSSDQPQSKAS